MNDHPTPREPRPGTALLSRGRIEIELDISNQAAMADFLEMVSVAIRARRRIVIAIE